MTPVLANRTFHMKTALALGIFSLLINPAAGAELPEERTPPSATAAGGTGL